MIRKSAYDQDQVERYRTDQECKKHGVEELDGIHGFAPDPSGGNPFRCSGFPMQRRAATNSVAALFVAPPNETFRLTLGNDRSRGLALADEAATKAQAGNHQNQRERDFLHDSPLFMDRQRSSWPLVQLVRERHSGEINAFANARLEQWNSTGIVMHWNIEGVGYA